MQGTRAASTSDPSRLRRLTRGTNWVAVGALVIALLGSRSLVSSPAAAAATSPNRVYFSQTGHYLGGDFLAYWQANGGLSLFGYPITEELDYNGTTVQYFERAVFEYHPDAPAGWTVELERLGAEQTASRSNETPFKALVASNNANTTFFPQTGHTLAFGFRAYWQQHGGLRIFGYPVSQEFTENGYTVQYFERARFEYHPSNPPQYQVELGLLGDTGVSDFSSALILEPQLDRQSNGMRIGCLSGTPDQYLTCEALEPQGFKMVFYLFMPKGYTTGTKYPLVLLLEGGGQRADPTKTDDQNRHATIDDPYVQVWGPGFPEPYSEDVQGNWPCFVVVPQPVTPARFVDFPAGFGSYPLTPQPNDVMRMTKEIVDTLQLVYANIDANRLYVTGLSMGGYGTWETAERWPSYWAAAAPIAGAGDPSKAARLVNLPIWDFHSTDDNIAPVSGSRDMINAIRAAGGNPKYTEYTNMGHGSWLAPYTLMGAPSPTPDFFSWLFAQRK